MSKYKEFKKDLIKNNPELENKLVDYYARIAVYHNKTRESYRKEIYDIEKIDPEIIEEDDYYKSRRAVYFCVDWLNETMRDLKVIGNHLYFTCDFMPYGFDGLCSGSFFIVPEENIYKYIRTNKKNDKINFKIEDECYFETHLDRDVYIKIKERF